MGGVVADALRWYNLSRVKRLQVSDRSRMYESFLKLELTSSRSTSAVTMVAGTWAHCTVPPRVERSSPASQTPDSELLPTNWGSREAGAQVPPFCIRLKSRNLPRFAEITFSPLRLVLIFF